jgi:hypothetical protein
MKFSRVRMTVVATFGATIAAAVVEVVDSNAGSSRRAIGGTRRAQLVSAVFETSSLRASARYS